jgi:hypothetical protein
MAPGARAVSIAVLLAGLAVVETAIAQRESREVPGLPQGGVTVGVRPDTVAGGGINQAGRGNAASDGSSAAGASADGTGIQSFDTYDLDGDGSVSKAEAAGHAALMQRFDRHDADRNGRLSRAEFEAPPKPPASKKTRKAKPAVGASTGAGAKAPRKASVGER